MGRNTVRVRVPLPLPVAIGNKVCHVCQFHHTSIKVSHFWQRNTTTKYYITIKAAFPWPIHLPAFEEGETEDDYRRRIIKCFVYKVFLFDNKLLIYYNVSRDGKTREQSEIELLEEALHLIDKALYDPATIVVFGLAFLRLGKLP